MCGPRIERDGVASEHLPKNHHQKKINKKNRSVLPYATVKALSRQKNTKTTYPTTTPLQTNKKLAVSKIELFHINKHTTQAMTAHPNPDQ
ncbi:hypothetical protein D3C78_1445840 [compost metagenome]